MVAGHVSEKIVVAKLATIEKMLRGVKTLPLGSEDEFSRDPRMVAAGESFLRRALEALLDLGRHVLAKGFGVPVAEYAAIADELTANGVLPPDLGAALKQMAGYRNRLVHGYDEVSTEELFGILTTRVNEVTEVCTAIRAWLDAHPDRIDRRL